EGISEELRHGEDVGGRHGTGFGEAPWALLDVIITTLITASVPFHYGTGPIKGFAVTLSIGIVTSVFTALVVTRLLYQLYPGTRTVSTLSI
nr:protein translocase subunit SecD [Pseudomonadota bacterium]